MADVILATLPIGLLVYLMVKPRPVPSPLAFAASSAAALAVGLFALGQGPRLMAAAVFSGLLDAVTPISIVFGAIFFFVAMERSGAMRVLEGWLRGISPNPVAQVMVAGFAFIFLIEAAAGFGTPAALAAPVLVALGFPALRVAVACLIFNTIPTAFGAAGTPVWFGFERLGLPEDELLAISRTAATLQAAAALAVPAVGLLFLVEFRRLVRNLGFVYLSVAACVVPMWLVAPFSYEFPVIAGGIIGLPATILLARAGIGLEKTDRPRERGPLVTREVARALLPLGATVGILLVTRIPVLGLRGLLTATEPSVGFALGALGEFSASAALVLHGTDLLGEGLSWSHATLYVPSLVPFVLTGALALSLAGLASRDFVGAIAQTATRIRTPVIALFGALVFVNILMAGGDRSPTMILGGALAGAAGGAWTYFAPFLGALGSFFSGSTTISNLMFGPIQLSVAGQTGIEPVLLLALQLCGAAMGNMICIHNIVAVCAVLGLVNSEGKILRMATGATLVYGAVLAGAVALGVVR